MSTSTTTERPSWLSTRLRSIRWHVRTRADAWLAIRMFGWRLVLPALKRVLPFDTLARSMRGRPDTRSEREQVVRLASWIYGSRRLTGGDNCLERSLLLYRYLSRTDPDARLVVGFRNSGQTVQGHAWVAVGNRAMAAETDGRGPYEPIVSFGRDGRIIEGARDGD
jgi:Transglutaminase-like superfamily